MTVLPADLLTHVTGLDQARTLGDVQCLAGKGRCQALRAPGVNSTTRTSVGSVAPIRGHIQASPANLSAGRPSAVTSCSSMAKSKKFRSSPRFKPMRSTCPSLDGDGSDQSWPWPCRWRSCWRLPAGSARPTCAPPRDACHISTKPGSQPPGGSERLSRRCDHPAASGPRRFPSRPVLRTWCWTLVGGCLGSCVVAGSPGGIDHLVAGRCRAWADVKDWSWAGPGRAEIAAVRVLEKRLGALPGRGVRAQAADRGDH